MGRILIWDENDDLRLALAVLVDDAGHEAIEASSFVELDLLGREKRLDAILIGLTGSSRGGFEAGLRAIEATRGLPMVPVIVVSSWTKPEDVAHLAESLGVFALVAMPWCDGEIESTIALALTGRKPAPDTSRLRSSLGRDGSPIIALAHS